MILDFDDLHESNHRLDLFGELKSANSAFRCTVFAIPGLCSGTFLSSLPSWMELAVHGWTHGDPGRDGGECTDWTRAQMIELMGQPIVRDHFVSGFKAPGWQISDGCYEALSERDWWLADQPYNDDRRPRTLRVHRLGDGDHWHGHVQNVCGNGLEETFPILLERVKRATSFELLSEVVR